MMQTQISQKELSKVGEEISHELGAQMISDYQTAYPQENKGYLVGSEIITQILNQPNCVGLRLCNGINEDGNKTIVIVGVDQSGNDLLEYSLVSPNGSLDVKKGIVADRIWENFLTGIGIGR